MNETVPSYKRLTMVDLRAAYGSEPVGFTPWLAANLDYLSDAIDLNFRFEATEVRAGRNRLDILAIANPTPDESIKVAIENQFGRSDHRHLGQILSYAASLDAKILIWVAEDFTDEHLKALEWLNEETSAAIRAYAVKVRAAQIGSSPYGILFEKVLGPSRRSQTAMSEGGVSRAEFWAFFDDRAGVSPQWLSRLATGGGNASRWLEIGHGLTLSLWIAAAHVGIFVRGERGVPLSAVSARLAPFMPVLRARLAIVEPETGRYPLSSRRRFVLGDREEWEEAAEWMVARATEYERVIGEVVRGQADGEA